MCGATVREGELYRPPASLEYSLPEENALACSSWLCAALHAAASSSTVNA